MNIIISPFSGQNFSFRSDSTLIRILNDYFRPDFVKSVSACPIVYIKMGKAGKAFTPCFTNRYLDSFGFGLLLDPELALNKEVKADSNEIFIKNALDYTTIIPVQKVDFAKYQEFVNSGKFDLALNGHSIFENKILPKKDQIIKKISEISEFLAPRIGDYIAFELDKFILIPEGTHILGTVSYSSVESKTLINLTIH
ncbi:MAG: hypothetical protein WC140_01595 [Bacteroidales bacterium]